MVDNGKIGSFTSQQGGRRPNPRIVGGLLDPLYMIIFVLSSRHQKEKKQSTPGVKEDHEPVVS